MLDNASLRRRCGRWIVWGTALLCPVARAETGVSYEISKVAEGMAWVSSYWGYNAPKLVYDGDQGVPDLELEPDPDAPGEMILRLDGEIAMRLTGAEALTADDILLVEADDGDVTHLPLPQ